MNTHISREVAARQFYRTLRKVAMLVMALLVAGFVGCNFCQKSGTSAGLDDRTDSASSGIGAIANRATEIFSGKTEKSRDCGTEHRIIDVPELKAREKAATTAPAPVRKAFQITIEATPAKLDPWQRQKVIAIVAESYAKIDLARIGVTWIIEDYVNLTIVSPRYNKGYDLSKVREVTRPIIVKMKDEFYYLGDIVVSGTPYETENFLKVFNSNLSENTAGLVIGEARPIRSAK